MYNESNVNLLDVAIREKKKTQLWKDAPVSALAHTSFTSRLLDVMFFLSLFLLFLLCYFLCVHGIVLTGGIDDFSLNQAFR